MASYRFDGKILGIIFATKGQKRYEFTELEDVDHMTASNMPGSKLVSLCCGTKRLIFYPRSHAQKT